ncbi:MAG: flagellar export chaperone FliS, partial [Acidimicrobiales bacterium]
MPADAYERYQTDAIAMASPARLVTLLYDHLALDLVRAGECIEARDVPGSHAALIHAQRIVMMLRSSLRDDLWEGGPDLRRIYDFLHREMVRANLYRDAERVRDCLHLVQPLQQ